MNARSIVMLFLGGLLCCSFSVPAHSQANSCTAFWYCGYYTFFENTGCQPTPPPGAYNPQPNGVGLVYTYLTNACPPPAAPPEVNCCPTCGGCENRGGAPISLVNGNTYIQETDVKVSGLSSGLALSRTWNSLWPPTQAAFQKGLFGPNWRSTYEERVFLGSDNYIKYSRSDGSFWSFAYAGAAYAPAAPANVSATLAVDSNNTYWTLTLQNGERRIFNYASGWLTSIVDRNGNATQLTYDALNRLVTVTDPVGRHLYFSYANNTSYLVTHVSSDVGLSLSYSYDSNGRLIQITKPDQTTESFSYDSNSLISAITDSNGKVLESHTYDSCGRGLTSARAGGVEAVAISYGQACWHPSLSVIGER